MIFVIKKIRTAFYRHKVMKAMVDNNNGLINDDELDCIRDQAYSMIYKIWNK